MPAYALRRSLSVPEKDALSPYSDLLAQLLFHRGILDQGTAERFIAPDYDRDTHDPFLLKDAEKSADRIIHAIKTGQKLAIYSDYDADGIPGAAMWSDFFNRINFTDFVIYIPHRHNEGFGLNIDAVSELAGQGVKLIVTTDCGISDVAPVIHANEQGVDVIITDHHEPPPELPPAFAIVDHKQADCAYPDKNLCGTGVAFKLIQAILKKDRFGLKEGHEKWLLDLVGMATLSDMVPLTGENRVFAQYGLTVFRKSPRLGLRKLLSKLKIAQAHVTEDDIAFMITPRINAASRMGVPRDAFDLLSATTDEAAGIAANQLDMVNNERKTVVATLVKEVKKTIHERHGARIPSVIVLGNPVWRPSLLGLAANSCAQEFDRPVFLWGRDGDGLIKGSCRSEGETHVVELMRAVPAGVLSQFGGHHHSGGFTVSDEAVHYLEQRLNEAAATFNKAMEVNGGAKVAEQNLIDAELRLEQVTYRLNDEISRLAPFGVGNRKPLFLFKSIRPASIRCFGKGSEHVELMFEPSPGRKLPAISFFGVSTPWASKIQPGQPMDLIASVEKSMFRGRPELRLRIEDIVA